MNARQFSNRHGSLIIVSNPWNYFLENQNVILQIFWENKCTVTSGIGEIFLFQWSKMGHGIGGCSLLNRCLWSLDQVTYQPTWSSNSPAWCKCNTLKPLYCAGRQIASTYECCLSSWLRCNFWTAYIPSPTHKNCNALTLDVSTLWLDLKIDRKKRVFFHLPMIKALSLASGKRPSFSINFQIES